MSGSFTENLTQVATVLSLLAGLVAIVMSLRQNRKDAATAPAPGIITSPDDALIVALRELIVVIRDLREELVVAQRVREGLAREGLRHREG